ncbi:hypothetical protein N2152v2_002625 [Parachlorella kessleri]
MPKIWFFTYNIGAVYFLPYINIFYRHLGFTEQKIGLLCALKPWVSAPAGNIVVSLADSWQAHTFVVLATYLICLSGRGLIAVVTGYGIQVFLALLTEAVAAPMGAITDAAVMAAATDEGGYGRQRMWASIGWGGMSPIAGLVVAHYGIKTAFAVYFVVVSLAFIPTCLLPISILTTAKKGEGSSNSGSGSVTAGPSKEGGNGSEIEVQYSRGSGSLTSSGSPGSRSPLSPRERRARMDSDIEGSKRNLLGDEAPTKDKPLTRGIESPTSQSGEQPWRVSARPHQRNSSEKGQAGEEEKLPYGVLHLTATATEQVQEMEGGIAGRPYLAAGNPYGKAALQLSDSQQGSIVGSGVDNPLLRDKAALSDDASSPTTLPVSEVAHGTIFQGLKLMLCDIHVVMFFFLAFCMGIGNGCIGFLFLYLDELGATGSLLGLCLSFNCLAEVPVFYYSGPLLEWLGVERAFTLAMCGYVLRLCAYIALPLFPSVWWVLPVELLQGLTFALAWSAGCVYVKRIAPVWLRSTTQSIFQGLYAGIGQGTGGLLGGFLYGTFGAHVVFKTAAFLLASGLGASVAAESSVQQGAFTARLRRGVHQESSLLPGSMTAISVTSVNVLDNPSKATNPLQFEIQYECLFPLEDDLEWKITYVGSAESEKYDQVLDTVFVGPVSPGQYRFVFQEFLRVGYYVSTEYTDEALRDDPPDTPEVDKLVRSILADKPRVTKFPIEWDPAKEASGMEVDS